MMVVLRRRVLAGVPGAILLPLASRVAMAGERGRSEGFAGLAPETQVGSCRVLHVSPVARGGRVILMRGPGGERFELEVLLRDPEGPRPPGESQKFAVFVRNAGNGSVDTNEDHGLAAMSLAAHLRTCEASVDHTGLLTLRERSTTYARELE